MERREFLSKTALMPICGLLPLAEASKVIPPPQKSPRFLSDESREFIKARLQHALNNVDSISNFHVTWEFGGNVSIMCKFIEIERFQEKL